MLGGILADRLAVLLDLGELELISEREEQHDIQVGLLLTEMAGQRPLLYVPPERPKRRHWPSRDTCQQLMGSLNLHQWSRWSIAARLATIHSYHAPV